MVENELIKVLLVEDDEDDYIITRDLLSEIQGKRFELQWASTFQKGLEAMLRNQHDICLLDYRLGASNGVELLRAARKAGCQIPAILLTTSAQHQRDIEAMDAGASDYLVKGFLQPAWLERSIRYAIQRKRAAAMAAFEQARLAAFGAEIGRVLARSGSQSEILVLCAKSMAKYLNAELAQISTFNPAREVFEVQASAGPIHERNHSPAAPAVRLSPAKIAQGKPILIRQLTGDENVVNHQWIKDEKLVSFAAYPLVLEDRLVGVMSIFAQHLLHEEVGQEMSSVANGIALCIERKRSEEALGLSESKYRSVVESINEVIFQLDTDGNWTFLNPAWTAITGFEVKESLGTSFLEYIHRDEREYHRRVFHQLMKRKVEGCRHETRCLTKDGQVRWVQFNARLILNEDNVVAGASGSLNDITERKLAETQVQKLAAFPRVNPNPVLEFSADGSLSYANDAAIELAKSLGHEDLLRILPSDTAAIARQCIVTGQKALRKNVVISGRTISWSFFPVADSPVVHCYGGDVTDVLNLEAQLRQAQKMECVGQLAAGVAHDINNVLTVVQGRAGLLLNNTPPGSDVERSLRQISLASERAARFIRQLLMFSRKQVLQTQVINLNTVIRNMETMLPRMLGEDIALETPCAEDISAVEGDTGMIEQVILNLAVNARDAMPRGGKLVISTSMTNIDENYAAAHTGSRPGRFVCLTVSDTGCGMDQATLERIFEPFFTTKEVGKGTGLGLATVYGIARQHRGWIEVQSEVGRGTTFKIHFPGSSQLAGSATDFLTKSQSVRGGTESILVAEDEDGLRELVQQILQQYQYEVAVAATGEEALRIWTESGGKFDLLLTDMIMPGGMTGRELAAELKKQKTSLKIIYTSGYSSELIGTALGPGSETFLAKPYVPPQLARAVRDCLDASSQNGEAAKKPANPAIVPEHSVTA
jgi:PAS domain S-box-containing protein